MKKNLILLLLITCISTSVCFAESKTRTITRVVYGDNINYNIINNYNSFAYSPSSYGNCSRGLVLYGNYVIAQSKAIYLPSTRKTDIKEGKRQELICN